ncbi:MAG TPA: hypothetical protein VNK96_05525 [Fimbriimonadales bacterium]|nr:hypothetical protein [Fimbriimonadales bacterium]
MLAITAGVILFALAPDVRFVATDGSAKSLSLWRGYYTLVVTGLNPRESKDLETIRGLAVIEPDDKKYALVCLTSATPEELSKIAEDARIRKGLFFSEEEAFVALGVREGGEIRRKAILVNPRGYVVKIWDGMSSEFAQVFAEWISGSSLPIGAEAFDPRPLFFRSLWEDLNLAEFGIEYSWRKPDEEKGLLVLFLSTTGSVDELYIERIRRIGEICKSKGVGVIGCFPNYDETPETVFFYAKNAKFEFPCAVDVGGCIADVYRATRTPEAFLLDSKGRVFYAGSIDSTTRADDRVVPYLERAIEALVGGKKPKPDKTIPFGTIIKRTEADERQRTG